MPSVTYARTQASDPLSIDELFARMHAGDTAARDALIELHVGFAHGLAQRYARRGEDIDDLQQVASYALVKAVDGFDPGRGVTFRAYASPTILGEIKRHFRDRTWAVHVPRGLNERSLEVERASRELTDKTGAVPGANELADYLGWSLEQVLEAVEVAGAHTALSLDRPFDDEDGERETLGDSIGDVDEGFDLVDHSVTIASAMTMLEERDRRVLEMRFGQDMTQSEIAAQIGVSQMQVSRILRRVLASLREETGAEAAQAA
jgi:RNA polymerase sigma-B factor